MRADKPGWTVELSPERGQRTRAAAERHLVAKLRAVTHDLESTLAQRVLLVEDNPDARFIYTACLTHARFEVVATGSAREALEAAQRRRPEGIVLDLRLPDRDGLDLLRQWRSAGSSLIRVPIIVLTAHAGPEDVEAARAAGCDDFLAKPCTGEILVARIARLLFASARRSSPNLR